MNCEEDALWKLTHEGAWKKQGHMALNVMPHFMCREIECRDVCIACALV